MGRGCCRVVCSDAARHGRTDTDGGGPREIPSRVVRCRMLVGLLLPPATPHPQLGPQAFAQPSLSLSLFVTNSFSIRILDTPPSRDTHARLRTPQKGNERSPGRDESGWQLLIST